MSDQEIISLHVKNWGRVGLGERQECVMSWEKANVLSTINIHKHILNVIKEI